MELDNIRNYQNFAAKLFAFFAFVFIVDFAIGSLLKKYYFKQLSGYDYQTTYAIEKTSEDILIFGSSRAVNIFNTQIFTNKLNLSCYNVGRYGEPVFYHYALLKGVLKRYRPKIIILSFDAGNFSKNQEAYDRLTVLLPYYKDHAELRSIVELKGPHEKIKLVSNIYPYNSLILSIITGNSVYSEKKYPTINGFIPINKTFTGPLQTFHYSDEKELDIVKINCYKSFIKECIDSGVKLFIVCPPYQINANGIDHSIIEAKKIALDYKINFIDYTTDSFYINNPRLFADYRHLNENGVRLFSNSVIKNILIMK